jgi:hypothetical protein
LAEYFKNLPNHFQKNFDHCEIGAAGGFACQAPEREGFISTVAKKRKVNIESSKNEAGDRVYKIAK